MSQEAQGQAEERTGPTHDSLAAEGEERYKPQDAGQGEAQEERFNGNPSMKQARMDDFVS